MKTRPKFDPQMHGPPQRYTKVNAVRTAAGIH